MPRSAYLERAFRPASTCSGSPPVMPTGIAVDVVFMTSIVLSLLVLSQLSAGKKDMSTDVYKVTMCALLYIQLVKRHAFVGVD